MLSAKEFTKAEVTKLSCSKTAVASQVVLMVKNMPANAADIKNVFDPWVEKIPWRRAWQPTPLFLLGESHGQRSLAGYSP